MKSVSVPIGLLLSIASLFMASPSAYALQQTYGANTMAALALDPPLTPAPLPPGSSVCRPDGMAISTDPGKPGFTPISTPYCLIYDSQGREKMGASQRRVIGYFTSWRTGKDGKPAYLVSDIPWSKLTHINFAFAHIDGNNRISVALSDDPAIDPATDGNNAALGMQWPDIAGAEMDMTLPYRGHFNLLTKFKKNYPNVKTLISVGGWAETGGYLNSTGHRVNSGGFYSMTTNRDGSVNMAGITTFADSTVAFLRKYGFDGVDIDYEYPTSMRDAGNPLDFTLANQRRAGLMSGYEVLLKILRQKLDIAAVQDNRYYQLTIAAPASGWLLRGMANFSPLQYLDFVNIMSYDLHGAWNRFVGPNAALFDDGKDAELAFWNMYTTPQYGAIGYLNTDWAYHYFRGALQAGRINIGVPYYTRGWQNVSAGTNGLWGKSVGANCPPGLKECGNGAIGIDNIWHDLDTQGQEVGSGSNPMWHAKNLEKNQSGTYITRYGLTPETDAGDTLTGMYTRFYNSIMQTPWLWNAPKRVFLSTEDEQSVQAKAQWVSDRGIGGILFWELAGDYDWDATRNNGKGEYYMGSTLTRQFYDAFQIAPPYGNKRSSSFGNNDNAPPPTAAIDVRFTVTGYPLGDANYPISPQLIINNMSSYTLPGGTEFRFDMPTSTPANIRDQSGMGLHVVTAGHTGNNIGGLRGDMHRVAFTIPNWSKLAPNASMAVALVHYLPATGPTNVTVAINGKLYALRSEQPYLPYIK